MRRAWDKFSETGTSEYLTRKGFASIQGLRYGRDSYGQFAAMPLHGPAGDFRGFQRFYDDGDKKLAKGTNKTGAYFLIPGSKPDIVVCEGLTTGASVALATGYTVAITVDCGNIAPAIASLKAVDNNQRIIIGADNDQWGDRNAGLNHAYAAAQQHGVDVAVPDFAGLDTSGKPTDFNDLHKLAGLAEVARQIDQAKPAPEQPQEIKPGVLLKGISEPDKGADLTPEAATAQLAAVISDFLDNPHRDGQPRKLLIRGAAGLGKTSQVRKTLLERGISAEIYTPSHKLANEQLQAFQADNIHAPSASWQGRQQSNEHGNPLCQRADAVQALESAGVFRVSRLLCGVTADGKAHDPGNVCPYAKQCLATGYFSKVREFSQADIKITQHALLRQPREHGQPLPDIAVIDENPLSSLIGRASWDPTAILEQSGILSAAAAALVAHGDGWLAELRKSHPQALAEVKQWLADHAPEWPDIQPSMPDSMIRAKSAAFAERKRPRGTWRFAMLLAEALASDSERYNGLYYEGDKTRATWISPPNRLADMPVLVLDGTAEADLLRRIWPELEVVEISVKRNAHVVQVWDTACSYNKLDSNPRKLRERIQHFTESLPGRGAVIGPKSFVEQLTANNAEIAHFGNLRGLDSLKSAEWGVIVSRNQPPEHDVEAIARALAPYDCLALGGGYRYTPATYRGQGGLAVAVHTHADPLVNTVLRQLREAESEQAIDRLRLVHNTIPKTVYLLSSLPVDVHVNELTALDDLLPDYRLAEALSRYPVLPLGRAWLAEHLPDVFKTPKAAERWLSQMPQNSINIYIGFWGIYHGTYRVQGVAGKAMRFISKIATPSVIAAELARMHGAEVTLHELHTERPAGSLGVPAAPVHKLRSTTVTSTGTANQQTEEHTRMASYIISPEADRSPQASQDVLESGLLPADVLPDDRRYLAELLARVPSDKRIALMAVYRITWNRAARAEPLEHRQANAGRRAANAWVRRAVDRLLSNYGTLVLF